MPSVHAEDAEESTATEGQPSDETTPSRPNPRTRYANIPPPGADDLKSGCLFWLKPYHLAHKYVCYARKTGSGKRSVLDKRAYGHAVIFMRRVVTDPNFLIAVMVYLSIIFYRSQRNITNQIYS